MNISTRPLSAAESDFNFSKSSTGWSRALLGLSTGCIRNGTLDPPSIRRKFPPIARTDGRTFQVFMNSEPVEYPGQRGLSVGFWYKHNNNSETETVVVLMRKPPQNHRVLISDIEAIADKLGGLLRKRKLLPKLMEFDGKNLRKTCY